MTAPLIELRDFRYTYLAGTSQAAEAVRGVSLQIERGERVAIVGPTDSGKSTVVAAFVHLLRLAPGQVFFEGTDISEPGFDRAALRRLIGIVFQDADSQIIEDVVGKDVAFGPTAARISAAETRQRVEESLNAVGLAYPEFRLRYVYALSGGQRRRVALAGVLAMRPPVLVLDEPLAGLDPRGRDDLLALLRRQTQDRDLTLVVCSSGLAGAALLCDRVVVLGAGRVVLEGTLTDVLRQADRLAELGVTLPESVMLARQLRRIFPDFPLDVLDEEDLAGQIVRRVVA